MDVKLVETLNGGDLEFLNRDMATVLGLGNMPYLAMFGGNVGFPTPVTRLESEQAFDWWGNTALMPRQKAIQFNSYTENALKTVSLTSQGRLRIEEAVKKDLQFMAPFAKVSVEVTIIGVDKVKIYIALQEPDNLQAKEFIYIWDGTRLDLGTSLPAVSTPSTPVLLNYGEQYSDFLSATNILSFNNPYTSLNYAPLVFDLGGAGLGVPSLFTNKMEVDAAVPGGLIAWMAALISPSQGIRAGLTTISSGTQPISFATLGDLDYTIIATDFNNAGISFQNTNSTKGFASFYATAGVGGGKVAWVVVKNNFFTNMRTGSDITLNAGVNTITFGDAFATDDYTLLPMDCGNVGTGNILNISKTAAGFEITVGLTTKLNYLAILN